MGCVAPGLDPSCMLSSTVYCMHPSAAMCCSCRPEHPKPARPMSAAIRSSSADMLLSAASCALPRSTISSMRRSTSPSSLPAASASMPRPPDAGVASEGPPLLLLPGASVADRRRARSGTGHSAGVMTARSTWYGSTTPLETKSSGWL